MFTDGCLFVLVFYLKGKMYFSEQFWFSSCSVLFIQQLAFFWVYVLQLAINRLLNYYFNIWFVTINLSKLNIIIEGEEMCNMIIKHVNAHQFIFGLLFWFKIPVKNSLSSFLLPGCFLTKISFPQAHERTILLFFLHLLTSISYFISIRSFTPLQLSL